MKNIPSLHVLLVVLLLSHTGCKKALEALTENNNQVIENGFARFVIRSGQQFCDQNAYKQVAFSQLKFTVRFDSSAIYTTQDPSNQYDINKLFGFSDNDSDHHQFSARYGWRWSDNQLRLFAYVYNQGAVISKELGSFAIGSEINCSIEAANTNYTFTTNGAVERLPRMATTAMAKGYQLYPYFGGDERAPHEIRIWIKQL
jgi:hypothetical protein